MSPARRLSPSMSGKKDVFLFFVVLYLWPFSGLAAARSSFLALRTALMVIDHLANISSSFKNILLLLTVIKKLFYIKHVFF